MDLKVARTVRDREDALANTRVRAGLALRALPGNLARIARYIDSWHDCTNIKVRPFSRRTDSKFRAVAPPQPLMKRCRWPRNSWTRRAAKSWSKSKLGPLGEPASAG